jgi:hypothetical protein|tara:strand:+ start:83 stop:1102 length:1020 start_codon:yes stop_codon:yes gene_type:complete
MKKIYFISGFPRAGNTVLASILNQNPKIKTTALSILPEVILQLDNIKKTHLYKNFPDEKSFDNLIENTFTNYYDQWDAEYIIERGEWITPYNLHLLQKYFKNNEIKIVILVRDILDILASILEVCKNNPEFYINKEYEDSDKSTVIFGPEEEKAEIIMHKNSYVYSILYSINHLLKEDIFKNYIFVEYDDLVSKPEDTLKNIYSFLDIKHFKHDFDNIKLFKANGVEYDDTIFGGDMHTITTGKIKKHTSNPIVSQRVINKYSGLEMWRKSTEKEQLFGQKENEELEESYRESQRQTKERTKPLASFSKDLQESIHKRTYNKRKDHATDISYENEKVKK